MSLVLGFGPRKKILSREGSWVGQGAYESESLGKQAEKHCARETQVATRQEAGKSGGKDAVLSPVKS